MNEMSTTHRPRPPFAAPAAAVLAAILAAPLSAETPWFPLETGNRWTYSEGAQDGFERIVTVTGQEGDLFVVDFEGTEVRLGYAGQDGVDLQHPEEGLVPYYRFDQDSWTHRDFRSCDDNRMMTIVSRDETVDTPAGQFTGCIRIEYGAGTGCADAGTAVEWWAPDVGRVQWVEDSFIGPRTWMLIDFSRVDLRPTFRRGDANADGQTNISDPVLILNWLFLGEEAPACRDAADGNDDGLVNLSDPIMVLDYLFLGRESPPAPGPDECGVDPTEDDIPECGPESCGGATLTGG
jgi:hypothetical protein